MLLLHYFLVTEDLVSHKARDNRGCMKISRRCLYIDNNYNSYASVLVCPALPLHLFECAYV
jgi:hypothetical protein